MYLVSDGLLSLQYLVEFLHLLGYGCAAIVGGGICFLLELGNLLLNGQFLLTVSSARFAALAHQLANSESFGTIHGAVGLCLGAIHLADLLVALLNESYEVFVAVVALFVDAEGAPLGILLVRVLFLVTNNVTLILLRGWIITFANRRMFVFKLLVVLVALHALVELCPTAGALLKLLKAHAVGLCQLVVVGIDGLARLVDFIADEFHHLLHATL